MAYYGQDLNSSPYTRFGLGEQVPMVSTPFIGLGGANVAVSDFKYINFSNPATYSNTKRYSPVFDAGVMGKSSFLRSTNGSFNKTTVALRDFSLLLPISPKTGFAFGLMPYSTTGYDINDYDPNEGDTITYTYSGMGSVNRLFFGLGQQIWTRGDSVKLSLGVNASFLFGTLQRDRLVEFDEATFVNTHLKNKLLIRGFSIDYGLHYFEKISEKLNYQIGLTVNLGNKVTAYQDFFAYTYTLNSIEEEIISDTTKYYEDNKGYVQLPKSFTIGGAVTMNKRVTLSAQFEIADHYKYYEYFDSTEFYYNELAQMKKVSFGIRIMPESGLDLKNVSALKLISYQIGANYGYAPYQSNDIHLKQYGIAFGISLPLLSSGASSTLNLGFELGKLGTTDNGLIEDNYFKFNLGLSLMAHNRFDKWFWKRLYD
ncbi:MAG: hypothetical protein H6600_04940 [Flavobacteriales bacterium]|nr:hypothetical protein [Flavobacteriales bacterium]